MTTRAQREKGGRAFAPARIAGLVVIGLVVVALGWLRLSSGDDAVSVPSGAMAGDLTLHDCRYETEGGGYAADCGTLVVPENRHEAGSRLIALPVTRVRARSAEPVEPIFRLQGGPGITNMAFPSASRSAVISRYFRSKMWSGSGRCGKATTWSGNRGNRMGRIVLRRRKTAHRSLLRASCTWGVHRAPAARDQSWSTNSMSIWARWSLPE